jgi:hypothetical protein
MLKRGFLGPIGDDLPSLIPLVFALTIFFTVFYLTFSTFNERNIDFDNDTSAIQIGAALRGAGLINSSESFDKLCKKVNIRNIDYMAGIILAENYEQNFIEYEEFLEGFKCNNVIDESQRPKREDLRKQGLDVVQRIYPVAINYNHHTEANPDEKISPGFLVVTVWRGTI